MMRIAIDHSFFLQASATSLSGSLPAVDAIARIALQWNANSRVQSDEPRLKERDLFGCSTSPTPG